MRKLYVPIMVDPTHDKQTFSEDFKKLGVNHLFLHTGARFPLLDEKQKQFHYETLQKAQEFYTQHGYECGVWISTLGYGGPLFSDATDTGELTQIRSIVGKNGGDAICPLDERFVASVEDIVRELARHGARMIMLDDELCLSVRPGLGCACDLHLAEFSRRMGEEVGIEGLPEKLFVGKGNAYRRTWLDMQGDTLRNFCRRLRAAVDGVDPTVRMGFCAGYTSWDTEGADAIELTYILAGKTKPFLRFTSAPYWYHAQRFGELPLPSMIEFARIQAAWTENEEIEVFTECDTYPHDRFHTPLAHIECFDIATMLTKNVGVLKYFYHYPCQPAAERGYVNAHLAAAEDAKQLQEIFYSMPETGVRVYEEMHKLKDATLPSTFDRVKSEKLIMKKYAFSEAQMMLSVNAVPTVYTGDGLCGIAFGENAKYLPESAFKKGLILDATAAEILQANGIDVGLRSCKPLTMGVLEDFEGEPYPISVYWASDLLEPELADGARVLSSFVSSDFEKEPRRRVPAAYLYENASGQRFLVYAFRAEGQVEKSGMYWSYLRGKQIMQAIPWLGGKELPAQCFGNPYLYCRCNETQGAVAVAYFNCTVDGIAKTEVKFARAVKNVKIIGGRGAQLNETTVQLQNVPAYGYVAVCADYI